MISETSMSRSRAMTGALTMLTASSIGRSRAASAAWVSGRVFCSATAPSYSMVTSSSPVSVSWPANEPSCSASFM